MSRVTPEPLTDADGLTIALPHPMLFQTPLDLLACLTQGASRAGFNAVSQWLSCPEKSRLRALGVHRKKREEEWPPALDELSFGSVMHVLLAARVRHGPGAGAVILGYQEPYDGLPVYELRDEDRLRLWECYKTYDFEYPLEEEPFEYVGIEAEIATDIRTLDGRQPCVRTVRYDKLVRHRANGGLYSLEHKTASRSGQGTVNQYIPQFMTQLAIFNSNTELVRRYGPLLGIIPDLVIKTQTPRCERVVPVLPNPVSHKRALEYLRLPDAVTFPTLPDGCYPRFAHSCWGKYRPCDFIGLCWENSTGDYEITPRS